MPRAKFNANAASSEFNAMNFLIRSIISGEINTAQLVTVQSVNEDKTLDVLPMVKGMDGDRNVIEPSIIYNVPFTRPLSGKNAFIIDPVVGDIGFIVSCQNDISSVKINKTPSSPLTDRIFSDADSLYIGGIASLNKEPERFIKISDDGVEVNAVNQVTVNSPEVTVNSETLNVNAETEINFTTPTAIFSGVVQIPNLQLGATPTSIGGATLDVPIITTADVTAGSVTLKTLKVTAVTPGTGISGPPQQ